MVEAETINSSENAKTQMPGSTKTYSYRFSRNSAVQTQSDRLLRCFLVATAFSPVHACLFLVFREHRTATAIYLF